MRFVFLLLISMAIAATAGGAYGEVDRNELYEGDRLMAAKRYEEAIVYWDGLLSKNSENPELLMRSGLAYSMMGNLDKAHELLIKAQSANPGDTKITLNLALLAHRCGDIAKAEEILLGIVVKKPWYPNVCMSLGRIAQQRGEDKKALEYYIREINNSSHGEAWQSYLMLKRKLYGRKAPPPRYLAPLLGVLSIACCVGVVMLCLRRPENVEVA